MNLPSDHPWARDAGKLLDRRGIRNDPDLFDYAEISDHHDIRFCGFPGLIKIGFFECPDHPFSLSRWRSGRKRGSRTQTWPNELIGIRHTFGRTTRHDCPLDFAPFGRNEPIFRPAIL